MLLGLRRLVRALSLSVFVVGFLVFMSSGVASSSPLDSGNWLQAGYMSTDAGMFNGNCNLAASGCSYGPDASGDFWSPSTETFSGQEILFITGDRQYWASGSYATVLSIVAAEGWVYTPNITWSSAGIGGTDHGSVTGNILSRGTNVEDPWVTIRGGHCAHETSDVFPAANDCNLVIWGEDNYNSDPIHPVLKNVSGGVEVYVSSLVPEPNTALLLGIGLAGLGMRRRRR